MALTQDQEEFRDLLARAEWRELWADLLAFRDEANAGLVNGEKAQDGSNQDDRFRGRLDFWKLLAEKTADAGGFDDVRGLTRYMEDRK